MSTAIVWFRRDLRLADNPALTAGCGHDKLLPLYIDDSAAPGEWAPGAASRWWLHHSLAALERSLQQRGSALLLRRGPTLESLLALIEQSGASRIYWNRLYEPQEIERDRQLKAALRERGIGVESFNAALLYEPWQIVKDNGEPYRVFTPYWRALQRQPLPSPQAKPPATLPPLPRRLSGLSLTALELLPTVAWYRGFEQSWQPGEEGAWRQLQGFLDRALLDYAVQRDYPAGDRSSRLSPHLHFGEIGPRQVTQAVERYCQQETAAGLLTSAEGFRRELAWREFAHYLLYHFPHTPGAPFNPRFAHFPWEADNEALLQAWQRGRTGIPIVDASMRELWHSGWMHNRLRMIVASLLTKNLLQHWQHGARWFWDTLVDADLAANTLGWQWVAGCGADAAPYFRIFNPVLQGQRFDRRGGYVRRWLPELAALPDNYLHRPWEAPDALLAGAGIALGHDYPHPIVDLKQSRQTALARYQALKQHRDQAVNTVQVRKP